jgi:hypothetical protein
MGTILVIPGKAMMSAIPERRVLELWQSALQRRTDLVTEESGPVTILYPGRLNDGRGADLKDAVIATGQGVYKGDIEIHVKSSAWREHGHHHDPAYNSVILHVVQENDTAGQPARLQNGLTVPTLALGRFSEEQAARRLTTAFTPVLTVPCTDDPQTITRNLEKAGVTRFWLKAGDYEESLVQQSPGQVLFRGMMTALGYSRNKVPMAKLAGIVPLAELENFTAGAVTDETCLMQLQSWQLGGAGLLPSLRLGAGQRPDTGRLKPPVPAYQTALEQKWQNSCGTAPMSWTEWEFFRVRPGNYPTRRIAAMSVWLTRFRKRGLLEELHKIIAGGGTGLGDSLTVKAEGFWGDWVDFGLPLKGPAPALVGVERAGEIAINAVLPFYAAWGRFSGRDSLADTALSIYSRYPAGAENSLEKHMRQQLGLPLKLAGTALKRQGLLHLYKTYCTQGQCGLCPLRR